MLNKMPSLDEDQTGQILSLPDRLHEKPPDLQPMTTAADLLEAANMVNKTFNKKKTGMIPPPHQEVYPGVLVGSRFAAKHVDIL